MHITTFPSSRRYSICLSSLFYCCVDFVVQHVTRDFFRILAHMAETFVFIYIGLGLFSFSQDYSHMMYVLWAVISFSARELRSVFGVGCVGVARFVLIAHCLRFLCPPSARAACLFRGCCSKWVSSLT